MENARLVMCAAVYLSLTMTSYGGQPLAFRAHVINADSEFCSAAAIDVSGDGRLDIVSGGWWYEAPTWTRHKLRDVERIGTRFDDYSNLPLDVDRDGDLDLVSVNYRSKSIYWVKNPGSSGSTWDRMLIDNPGPSETGRLVDVDGDGSLDILPNGVTFAAWYSLDSNDAAGSAPVWTKHDLPSELAGHGIGAGDLNGDGRMDLVAPNGWAEAPAEPKSQRWQWHADFKLARDCSVPILVFDVDGDGDSDLVWGRGHNVGVYWTEQRQGPLNDRPLGQSFSDAANASVAVLNGSVRWVTHAIDTSWSCAHAPMLGDLDGDGIQELVVGKRFQGHEGKDPGENEPLAVFSYQFNPESRSWLQRIISRHPQCGLDLDPKCVDIDADGDLDILAPARSGLVLLENIRLTSRDEPVEAKSQAAYQAELPDGIQHHDFSTMLVATEEGFVKKAVTHALDVGARREQIQRQMEVVMGPLPTSERRVPLRVAIDSSEKLQKYTRIKLTYEAERGDRVPAYLLIPNDLTSPAPAMLCLHPTHFELGKAQLLGMGGKPSQFYAHELAERGMVCLVPDYPGFGEYPYNFARDQNEHASGTMKAIWNNIRGVDLLEMLPCVEQDAIGCIGHSLGGHNALFTAAFDVRLRAVVTSCGFNAFEDYYGGNLKGWTSDRYMPRIASSFDSDPQRMPFDFPEVLGAIAPRPLFVNAPQHDANFAVGGVRKCEAAVKPVYKLLGQNDDALKFLYPDAEHDFPDEIRQQTYDWLDKHLRQRP